MTHRRYLTASELRDMLERQHGVCASPECMSEGPFEADHFHPVALGNDAKPDQLLCVPCHAKKTNGLRGDKGTIAHIKRLRDGRTQFDKRKERGSRINGGGFKGWRNFKGEVVRNGRS